MLDINRKDKGENILISSVISGSLSSLLVNPLDVLKIRTQMEHLCKCLECSYIQPLQSTRPNQLFFSFF